VLLEHFPHSIKEERERRRRRERERERTENRIQ